MHILNASQMPSPGGDPLHSIRFLIDSQLMRTTPAADRPDQVLISRVGIEQWQTDKGEGYWVRVVDRRRVKDVRSLLRAQLNHSNEDMEYIPRTHLD